MREKISCTDYYLIVIFKEILSNFFSIFVSFSHNYCNYFYLDYSVQFIKSHSQTHTLKARQLIRRFTRDPFMHSPWVEVHGSERRQPNCPPRDRPKQGSLSLSITPRSWYTKAYRMLLTYTCTHPFLHVGEGAVALWICMTHAYTQSHTQTAVISPGSYSKPAEGGFVDGLV